MIDQAGDLERYLPISYRTPKEQNYVRFLWEAFNDNCESGKFQFGFLAYHMLTMCFVYFNIWQIKLIDAKGFATALIGFGKDMEKDLLEASSPFVFSIVNERAVLRFLKLIQCDNGKIGTYAKLVDDRNETAHSNGNIFFSTEEELSRKIGEIIRVVAEIQGHSKATIEAGYLQFLTESADPDEREHADHADQVREVLIHQNYMSLADLEFCAAFEIAGLADAPHFAEIEALHAAVKAWLESEDPPE